MLVHDKAKELWKMTVFNDHWKNSHLYRGITYIKCTNLTCRVGWVWTCDHHHNQNIEHSPHPRKFSRASSQPIPSNRWCWSTFCHSRLVLPVVKLLISGLYFYSWVCLCVCIVCMYSMYIFVSGLFAHLFWKCIHVSVVHYFYCLDVFHCMDIPQFVFALICCLTFEFFPGFGYYE